MTNEINNRDYIGMYKIVANTLRKDKLNNEFETFMKEEIFAKYYEDLKTSKPEQYSRISPHSISSPKERNVAINPVLITSKEGVRTIHYFVSYRNSSQIYEWTYFEPKEVPTNFYGGVVVEQIGSLSDWNFSVDNLDDQAFWKKYVFKKDSGKYIYLSKVG